VIGAAFRANLKYRDALHFYHAPLGEEKWRTGLPRCEAHFHQPEIREVIP
jgi:hypothetical protein